MKQSTVGGQRKVHFTQTEKEEALQRRRLSWALKKDCVREAERRPFEVMNT